MSLSGCMGTNSPGPIRAHGQPVTTKPASWRQGPASHRQLAVGAGEGRTQTMVLPTLSGCKQQFSFWWTGVRPKGHTGLEKDWAAILGRLGLIQGRDGGARQPAERRAALL